MQATAETKAVALNLSLKNGKPPKLASLRLSGVCASDVSMTKTHRSHCPLEADKRLPASSRLLARLPCSKEPVTQQLADLFRHVSLKFEFDGWLNRPSPIPV